MEKKDINLILNNSSGLATFNDLYIANFTIAIKYKVNVTILFNYIKSNIMPNPNKYYKKIDIILKKERIKKNKPILNEKLKELGITLTLYLMS